MSRQRSPGVEYSRHTLEDRPETEVTLKLVDSDGNIVSVGSDNPVYIRSYLSDLQETLTTNSLLGRLLDEITKTNMYLAEMMGDEFNESD